jgi:cell division protein FtsW
MRPERLLAGAVLALVCFGLVMVFSASSATALLGDSSPLGLVTRQLIYALIGLGLYLFLSRVRPEALRDVAGPAVAISLFLLVAVLVIGAEANGARRWVEIGPLQAQPSELAKLAVTLWVAALAARRAGRLEDARELRPFVLLTALTLLLILVEPDLGTAVVLLLAVLVMLVVAGARPRHVAAVAGGACALGALAIALEPYRRARLLAFLDPWHDSTGAGFQIVQAKLALGSGGVHGVGLGDGLQKVFYLPEAHTDMIVATVGEELGLLGVLGIIVAFALVAAAGYRIAAGARDLHQQVLAAGLTTLIVAQAVVNLGAVLGVLPVTGVPLPFVSFGGSSLLVSLASAGILVNIGRRSAPARAGLRAIPGGAEGGHRRGRDRGARHARARAG